MTSYTDRGQTDFDTVMQILNPYGTWSKIDGLWAYTPLDHQAPYTHGRWIYTEYGWYWKGDSPHSWATEHYGYWKRGANKVWSWYPGPYWLPEIVEIRATDKYLGWRSAAVDQDGDFMERPEDRYAKTDEWTFVTLAQFANPITPGIVAKPDLVKSLLEDSTECRHTYLTYREIDRPGPHPADFIGLCKDGGMIAPQLQQDEPAPPLPSKPVANPNPPIFPVKAPVTGTNAPVLMGTEVDPTADTRKVKYWITMSLPTYWTKSPSDAKPEEIYLYRPDFFQDDDGIQRRISLWLDPSSRKSSRQSLQEVLAGSSPATKPVVSTMAGLPALPAVPVMSDTSSPAHDPFQSPFDDSYKPSASSKNPVRASAPPDPNTPIPLPVTNTAPANPR